MQEDNQDDFKRELGLLDGTMLVAGSMIGSGIFIVSSDMVRQLGSLACYVGFNGIDYCDCSCKLR
jgi:amino acid permease